MKLLWAAIIYSKIFPYHIPMSKNERFVSEYEASMQIYYINTRNPY